MSPPPSSTTPPDLPIEQLLREFLRDYRREREELREERKEIRKQMREQNVEIQKTQTETLRLVGLVNLLEQKVAADVQSLEREIGTVKEDVTDLTSGVDGVVEQTGQHEIAKLKEELLKTEQEKKEELIKREKLVEDHAKQKREWVRAIALAAISLAAGLCIAWFGATVKGCESHAAASPARDAVTAAAAASEKR